MLSTRVQKSMRSPIAARIPRLNLLCRGNEERLAAIRAYAAACLLKQIANINDKLWVSECISENMNSEEAWLTLLKEHVQNNEYFRNNPV